MRHVERLGRSRAGARNSGGKRAEAAMKRMLAGRPGGGSREPCLRCGELLPRRLMGCKGGCCPHCGHLYPHGDCSD